MHKKLNKYQVNLTDANHQALASDELISKAIINKALHIKSSQLPFYYHNINSNPSNRTLLHTRITSKSLIRSFLFPTKKKKKGSIFGTNNAIDIINFKTFFQNLLWWQIIIGATLFPHGITTIITLLHTNHKLPPQQM